MNEQPEKMPELKDCPFCGSDAKEHSTWMCCTNPKCHLFNSACRDSDEWNTRATPPKSQGVEEAIAWAKKEILASREKANDCRFPDHIAKLSLIYAQRLESLISATRQQDGRVEGLVKALENALPFIRKDLHSKLANLEFTALEQALRAFRSKE